ncbi:MAG TPA: winged helix-turn-helix domain-containing protein [Thermoanaerobaculia bacterium]|nr:winged helix-turn-helix domain-containing protein [Thermoanaerobaculia bacterium]
MRPTSPLILAFGEHELHLDSGELFRAGEPVKLQPQPAKVLEVLARRAGEVVSREEIQALVWGETTFLDADANLNFCIKQIRRALDDPASSPRYVETIPRRGYRFLVSVETRQPTRPAAAPARASSGPAPGATPRPRRLHAIGLSVLAAGLVLLALFAATQRPGPPKARIAAHAEASPISEEAREHYRTALYLSPTDSQSAREELRQALRLDPRYAEAHARLAWEESQLERPPEEVLPDLELTARKAVELDPGLGLAHLALGRVLWETKLDWKHGEAELRKAVELDPKNAEAWHALAKLLAGRGEHDKAIAAARRARDLDSEGMLVNADLAWFYYLGRQYDEAVRQASSVLALQESREREGHLTARDAFFFRWAWRVILYSSLKTGDRRAGIEAARALMAEQAKSATAVRLTSVEEYWRWERERLSKLPRQRDRRPDVFAHNAAAAGQTDLALAYLEKACQRKWPVLLLVAAADPLFDSLHGDPRFEGFLDCIGLPADAPARRR